MKVQHRYSDEIQRNIDFWEQKPILRKIYNGFYSLIVSRVNRSIDGIVVELGSGIGNLKTHLPECLCTDIVDNPWIDKVENAYQLSFEDNSVSNLILFDVWHHLEFPAVALHEFARVLTKNGQVIIFEPYISLLGWIVYGLFHPEDVAWFKKINVSKSGMDTDRLTYYAAQGNATRFFQHKKYVKELSLFQTVKLEKIPAIAYVLSGGYSKKQLFPDSKYGMICKFESMVQKLSWLFATRLLVVLKKK